MADIEKIVKDLKKYQHLNSNIALFYAVCLLMLLVTTTLQMPWKHKIKLLLYLLLHSSFFFRFVYLPFLTSLICVDFIVIFIFFRSRERSRNRPGNSHLPNVPFEFTFYRDSMSLHNSFLMHKSLSSSKKRRQNWCRKFFNIKMQRYSVNFSSLCVNFNVLPCIAVRWE